MEIDIENNNNNNNNNNSIPNNNNNSESNNRLLPQDIEIPEDDMVFQLAFHPTLDLIAAGLVSGKFALYRFGFQETQQVIDLQCHKGSIRSLQFSKDGKYCLTASSDKTMKITDLEAQKVIFSLKTGSEINVLTPELQSHSGCVISGDDDGVVALWDMRTSTQQITWHEHDEHIAGLVLGRGKNSNKNNNNNNNNNSNNNNSNSSSLLQTNTADEERCVISAGADGVITALDIRKNTTKEKSENPRTNGRIWAQSDSQMCGLNGLAKIRNGRGLLAITDTGTLDYWSWGEWQSRLSRLHVFSAAFNGINSNTIAPTKKEQLKEDHKWMEISESTGLGVGLGMEKSVDSIATLGSGLEELALLGCSDGLVRVCSVGAGQPIGVIGVAGEHGTGDLPVEVIALQNQNKWMATAAHDSFIQFWDVQRLVETFTPLLQKQVVEDPESHEKKVVFRKKKKNDKNKNQGFAIFEDLL